MYMCFGIDKWQVARMEKLKRILIFIMASSLEHSSIPTCQMKWMKGMSIWMNTMFHPDLYYSSHFSREVYRNLCRLFCIVSALRFVLCIGLYCICHCFGILPWIVICKQYVIYDYMVAYYWRWGKIGRWLGWQGVFGASWCGVFGVAVACDI